MIIGMCGSPGFIGTSLNWLSQKKKNNKNTLCYLIQKFYINDKTDMSFCWTLKIENS